MRSVQKIRKRSDIDSIMNAKKKNYLIRVYHIKGEKMKKFQVYQTEDGKIFKDYKEAVEHEHFCKMKEIMNCYFKISELSEILLLLNQNKIGKDDFVEYITKNILEFLKDFKLEIEV